MSHLVTVSEGFCNKGSIIRSLQKHSLVFLKKWSNTQKLIVIKLNQSSIYKNESAYFDKHSSNFRLIIDSEFLNKKSYLDLLKNIAFEYNRIEISEQLKSIGFCQSICQNNNLINELYFNRSIY
uniref:Uncharacterized protein n=1 Tax=Climaconeis cf. scalaris TaxID=2846828 RepID=A0A8F8SRL6_9STRA|nr:hypothetical protein [Climaconeis cf. scalaris]QYB19136.1 hypothetical protein [Climaconeis cf. scalaris]